MTSLTSGRFQLPLNLTEGNTVDFVFRLSNNGVLFTPALTPVWIFGIKDADTPNGDFLIQVNSATAASGVFTFVVELASAELQTWLATATSQSYAAIQITDSANDIATGPLLCQIEPNQNDSGTTPTSANGTVSVAAGKTVTFPLTLTFPSAAGTNGYHLALLNSTTGTTEWVVDATGTTIATDPIWTAAGQLVYGTGTGTAAALAAGATTAILVGGGAGAPVWTVATGTGKPVRENAPTLIDPVLGVATVTSLNAATGTLTLGAQTINLAAGAGTNSAGGSINLSGGGLAENAYGGSINLSGSTENGAHGGSINLSAGVGDDCAGGSLNLSGSTAFAGGSINLSGGASNPGGSITTTAGGSITTGVGSLTFTGAGAATFALGASTQIYAFPTTTATLARTDAAQTFTGVQTITGTTQNSLIVSATSAANAASPTNCVAVFQQGTGTGGVGVFTDAAINLRATAAGAYVNAFIGSSGAGIIDISGNGSSSTLRVRDSNSPNAGTVGVSLTAAGNITAIGTLAVTLATTLTGNLTSNGALISTPQALSGTTLGAISITTLTTTLAATGVATATLTATGVVNGQIKVIVMTQATGACTVTVTNASWGGATTAVFDAVGDTLILQYLNSKWTPISNIGVVLA